MHVILKEYMGCLLFLLHFALSANLLSLHTLISFHMSHPVNEMLMDLLKCLGSHERTKQTKEKKIKTLLLRLFAKKISLKETDLSCGTCVLDFRGENTYEGYFKNVFFSLKTEGSFC